MDLVIQSIFVDEKIVMQRTVLMPAVIQRADVATGAKRLFSGAAQHYRVDLGIGGPGVQASGHGAHHAMRQRIQDLGAVQRDQADLVDDFEQDFVFCVVGGRGQIHGL